MADANQNASTGASQPNYVDLTADIVAAYVSQERSPKGGLTVAHSDRAFSVELGCQRRDGTAAGGTAPCGADQEISHTRFPDLLGRWSEVQKSQEALANDLQSDSRRVSGEVGSSPQDYPMVSPILRGAFKFGKDHGSWTKAFCKPQTIKKDGV